MAMVRCGLLTIGTIIILYQSEHSSTSDTVQWLLFRVLKDIEYINLPFESPRVFNIYRRSEYILLKEMTVLEVDGWFCFHDRLSGIQVRSGECKCKIITFHISLPRAIKSHGTSDMVKNTHRWERKGYSLAGL